MTTNTKVTKPTVTTDKKKGKQEQQKAAAIQADWRLTCQVPAALSVSPLNFEKAFPSIPSASVEKEMLSL